MKRVLLISSPSLFGTGLELLLGGQGRLEIVGEASSPETALERVRTLRPEVVIAVKDLPACDPAAIAATLFEAGVDIKVIQVSLVDKVLHIYSGEQRTLRSVADLMTAIGEQGGEGREEPAAVSEVLAGKA